LVDPGKVISLTLAPTLETLDQIDLFISYFQVRQFNQLRSLTLIDIRENQLKEVMKRFQYTYSLTSFSFNLGPTDNRYRSITGKLLSSILTAENLCHLNLHNLWRRVHTITWPVQCPIRYLIIGFCNKFDQILTILRCSPHLKTLIVKFSYSIDGKITLENSSSTTFHQITSITLEDLSTNIENLEFLLSLMPSLTHLKLIGSEYFMDGNRWEQFIQTNLLNLNQFELVVDKRHDGDTLVDIESILAPFQTPFWIEHKKWYFTCEYFKCRWKNVKLYSIPICETSLTYESRTRKTSLSTFDSTISNNVFIMDHVHTIKFLVSNYTSTDIDQLFEVSINMIS
jgi:hypothetical protein